MFRRARAQQPEIVRAVQKDQQIIGEISGAVHNIVCSLAPNYGHKYNHNLIKATELCYDLLTILSSIQSLGEEYTGLLRIHRARDRLPSKKLQLYGLLLQYFGATIVRKIINHLSHVEKWDILQFEQPADKIMQFCSIASRALFYLCAGNFYLSKRILNIDYLCIKSWISRDRNSSNALLYKFRLIGLLMFTKLLLWPIIMSKQNKKKVIATMPPLQACTKAIDDLQISLVQHNTCRIVNKYTCTLCLDICKDTTVAWCGHKYCWACLTDWLVGRSNCPICRQDIDAATIVRLRNI